MENYIKEAMEFIDKYKYHYGWREDEIQDAYIIFLKYYNPTKAAPSTFIKLCIDTVIKESMRKSFAPKHQHTKVYLDSTFDDSDDVRYAIELKAIENADSIIEPMQVEEDHSTIKYLLKRFLDITTTKQREILEMHYFQEKKIVDIARELNKHKSAVSMLHNDGLRKIRKYIKENNIKM